MPPGIHIHRPTAEEAYKNNRQTAYNTGYGDRLASLPFMGDEFKSTYMLKAYKEGYEAASNKRQLH